MNEAPLAPYTVRHADPLECAIVRALLLELHKAGYEPVAVWDTEEYVYAKTAPKPKRARSEVTGEWAKTQDVLPRMSGTEVLDAVFSVDGNPTLHFAPIGRPEVWGDYGVMLVIGNGVDIISDYHSHAEDAPVWRNTLDTFGEAIVDGRFALALTVLPKVPRRGERAYERT